MPGQLTGRNPNVPPHTPPRAPRHHVFAICPIYRARQGVGKGVASCQTRRGTSPLADVSLGCRKGCRQQKRGAGSKERVQAAPEAFILRGCKPGSRCGDGKGGRGCSPEIPASEMLTAGVAVRMRPSWGLEGDGMFVFLQREGDASQPLPLPRTGPGWRAARKGLASPGFWVLPSVIPVLGRAAGPGFFLLPRTWSFALVRLEDHPKTPIPESWHPAHPAGIPAESFSTRFWQRQPKGKCQDCCSWSPEQGEGQRDLGKGQEREAASRSQAGDSQEAEGICP